jgi:hypothetical protein
MKKTENSITRKKSGKLSYNYIYNNINPLFSGQPNKIQLLLGIIIMFTKNIMNIGSLFL